MNRVSSVFSALSRPRSLTLVGALLAALAAPAAQAQDEAPICTDRPTKANATCSVPQGHWQIETDIGNYIRDDQPGVRTETTYFTNPMLKYGLGERTDIQLNWSPHMRVRTTDRVTGQRQEVDGQGDVYLRLKHRFHEGERVSVGVIPFVKAPTAADGVGNDEWEGGVALPIGVSLPNSFSLTFGPEVDLLIDSDGSGHHPAIINLINLARPVSSRMSVAVELWSSINYDPAQTIEQYSADVAATWLVTPVLQLDVGANFGLNDTTPDSQLYVGLSHRF